MRKLFIIPSGCSVSSLMALESLGLPYQICIATAELRKSEQFLKINPLGKVATLIDNGVTVYENMAVLLYLADTYSSKYLLIVINY